MSENHEWKNKTMSEFDVKTERKVEWQRAGLTFFIVVSGMPGTCSCYKLTSALKELF